jgi:hypothetical protein
LFGKKSEIVIRMEAIIKEKSEVVKLGNEVVVFEIVQRRPYDRFQKIMHILILHNFSFTRIKVVTQMMFNESFDDS